MHFEKYLAYAVELVCRVFDVDKDELLNGGRAEDVVDARCALIHILDFQGGTVAQIERWLGLKASSQIYLLRGFDERKNRPWFHHLMVALIKDAKETCPIAFKAHNREGSPLPERVRVNIHQ